jgi:hypothetical protein
MRGFITIGTRRAAYSIRLVIVQGIVEYMNTLNNANQPQNITLNQITSTSFSAIQKPSP